MRFLADMGVSIRVVEWLRHEGHDVHHLRDENLHRLGDREIFAKAARETRTVLTFDLDFGEILALSGDQTVSVVLFRLRNARTPHVIERLRTVIHDCGGVLGEGAIVVVEESRHRVRRLPFPP